MTFLDHTGNHGFRADIGSHEVNVNHATEILNRHLLHRYALDDTGIVDKDIDCAHGFFNVSYHCLYCFFIGDVAEIAFCIDTKFLVCLHAAVNGLLTRAVEHYFCTCLRVCTGDGETYSISGTGYECHFSF